MIKFIVLALEERMMRLMKTQLMVIATDPTLYEILDDYTPELLEDLPTRPL